MAGRALPFVPFFALPPEFFVRLVCYMIWDQGQIFCGMPDLNKRRIHRLCRTPPGHSPGVTDGHLLSRELVREEIADFQVWPFGHFQYTSFSEPGTTSYGVRGKFSSKCLGTAPPDLSRRAAEYGVRLIGIFRAPFLRNFGIFHS